MGFTADTLALTMLFRPYGPIYIFGRQLPLTPGLFPRGQARFARKVATTLTDKLLTPDEVQLIARRLLSPQQLEQGLRWILLYTLGELNNPQQRTRLAQALGAILQKLFEQSLPSWTTELSKASFMQQGVIKLFDQVVLPFQLSKTQSTAIAGWINERIFTPEILRQALLNGLSDSTIEELDRQAKDRSQGGYWLLANVVGIKGPLTRLKEFCRDQPEQARLILQDLVNNLGLKNRLADLLMNLKLSNLPPATLESTRTQVVETLQQALTALIPEISQRLGEQIQWAEQAEKLLDQAVSTEAVLQWIDPLAQEGSRVLDQYLSRELEQLIAKFLPALGLEEIVIDKVSQTSPAELEAAIQGVVRQELRTLPYVGMVMGALVGILEIFLFMFLARFG